MVQLRSFAICLLVIGIVGVYSVPIDDPVSDLEENRIEIDSNSEDLLHEDRFKRDNLYVRKGNRPTESPEQRRRRIELAAENVQRQAQVQREQGGRFASQQIRHEQQNRGQPGRS